jgi:hypothetical protein
MRNRYYDILFVAGLLTITAPLWGERTDVANLRFEKPVHFGAKTLDAGDYVIRGPESSKQLEVVKDGKVVAEVPCHWVQLDQRSPADEALMKNDSVNEIRFEGRTAAAKID